MKTKNKKSKKYSEMIYVLNILIEELNFNNISNSDNYKLDFTKYPIYEIVDFCVENENDLSEFIEKIEINSSSNQKIIYFKNNYKNQLIYNIKKGQKPKKKQSKKKMKTYDILKVMMGKNTHITLKSGKQYTFNTALGDEDIDNIKEYDYENLTITIFLSDGKVLSAKMIN